jgi:hypothetical protein
MVRFQRVFVALAIAYLVGATTRGTAQSQDIESLVGPDLKQFVLNRNSSWDARLRVAGKPARGEALRAWLLRDPARVKRIELVLSERNIGDSPITVAGVGGTPADVLIRDAGGKPARLTAEGLPYYSASILPGSFYIKTIAPGDCHGTSVDITDDFILRPDEVYTVLPGIRLGESLTADLVAEPLKLKLSELEASAPIKYPTWIPPQSPVAVSPDEPSDREWAEMRRDARVKRNWCVLEQLILPDSNKKPGLAISLTCVDREGHEPAIERREATSYKLIVRDPQGFHISIDVKGVGIPEEWRRKGHYQGFMVPKPGDGIGSILSLSEYKQFAKPGRYWVMATLSDPKQPGSKWVAEPVQIDIGGASRKQK